MNPPRSLILAAPYPGDRLASIERFVRCLAREMAERISVRVITPHVRFGRLARSGPAAKWLGYLDKFVIFPRQLRRFRAQGSLVHFPDQSFATYTKLVSDLPHLLTCHDLLAVRSARGEFPEHRTGWSGRRLQRMILRGLEHVNHAACVSRSTQRDLMRLTSLPKERVSHIPMGLHSYFAPAAEPEKTSLLHRLGLSAGEFILHVGGNQWYKNRIGVVRIYRELLRQSPGAPRLLLVGKPPGGALAVALHDEELAGKVQVITDCSDVDLRALYSAASLLLFPSFHEGFGWPIIEAQACGCRVVTTNAEPMSEISGDAAALIEPRNIEQSARTVAELLRENESRRSERIAAGLRNAARFSTEEMISKYLEVYERLLRAPVAQSCVVPAPA